MNSLWSALRWSLAVLVVGVSAWALVSVARHTPRPFAMSVPFELWYGNWRAVVLAAGLFTLFLLGFTRPRRRAEWRNAGVAVAFFISLFTEMFGVPLTIYLIAPLLGLPPWVFGLHESHLLAFALDDLGLLPLAYGVYLVMVVSTALIGAALSLLVVGWATVYRGRGGLVTGGIYRYLRHPQYLSLILIVIAFNIQWPTLPTVVMAPILIVMYVRLARREDLELATVFGGAFIDWAARTPAFISWGGRVDRRLRARAALAAVDVSEPVNQSPTAAQGEVVATAGAVIAGGATKRSRSREIRLFGRSTGRVEETQSCQRQAAKFDGAH